MGGDGQVSPEQLQRMLAAEFQMGQQLADSGMAPFPTSLSPTFYFLRVSEKVCSHFLSYHGLCVKNSFNDDISANIEDPQEAAKHFANAVRLHGEPMQLLGLIRQNCPEELFNYIIQELKGQVRTAC